MRKLTQTLLVLAMSGCVLQALGQSPSKTRSQGISVRLVQPDHKFGVKDLIPLRVELANESDQTLFVCRELYIGNTYCRWEFEVHDPSGRLLPEWKAAGDYPVGPPKPFPNALTSNWIALPSHYTYGTEVEVAGLLGKCPRPGRYILKASLSSDGPGAETIYNDLLRYPNELAALPFAGWKGKAQSNAISIEIDRGK